jgi:hypothetical protein
LWFGYDRLTGGLLLNVLRKRARRTSVLLLMRLVL